MNTPNAYGRAILLGVLLSFVCVILLLLTSLVTPLISALTAYYLTK